MRLRPLKLVRELSGRSSADMTALLVRQITASLQGARMAQQAAGAALPTGTAREGMAAVEHAGDEAREELVTSLAATLVTPIDREDMFRLSRSIDDVLDNLRDFVRELDLFQTTGDLFTPVFEAIIDGLDLLHHAVDAVTGSPGEVRSRTLVAKKSCNEIRRMYEQQLARLLYGDVTADMLRRRELLRRLDIVGLRLGEATDALADAAIKRTM